jgi:rRNA maturation protein Nop10
VLRKCPEDGRYTLQETCPDHPEVETVEPGPAKYSPEDRHGEYRRKLKLLDRQESGADAEE